MTTIAPDLVTLVAPIDSVGPFPGNPRQGDIGAISESLRVFGQTKPVVVQRGTRHIVAGNHLWKAAKALGWSHIAVVEVDMDDLTARRYLIADNRTQELGSYESHALAEMLVEFANDEVLEGTGYDHEDVDRLLSEIEALDAGGHSHPQRSTRKSTTCSMCEEEGGLRFHLKLVVDTPLGERSKGAGSLVLCETCWLAKAAGEMLSPVESFEELRRVTDADAAPDGPGEGVESESGTG